MKEKNQNTWLYLSILSVFACTNCMGAIDGALSKLSEALNVSQTTALYVGSFAALASMISSLLCGMVLGKKLPYKIAAVFCTALAIVGGTIPVFAKSFTFILITRLLFGLGLGGLMALQNPLATKLLPVEKRASILGIGTSVSFTVQCVLQLIGGVLADVQWNYAFLVYLLLFIPLAIQILHLPKIELDEVETKQKSDSKFPIAAILLSLVMGIVGLNLAPLLFGSAFYASAINDSATIAAVIAMMYSLGSMIGGLIFPILYHKLKRNSLSVFLLIGATGVFISAIAKSIVILALGFLLGGIGNACMMAGVMAILGMICQPNQVAFASSLMMAFFNLGAFLCSSWESFLGSITGDSLYTPLYVGAVTFVVIAIILFIKSPIPKETDN